MHLKPVYPIVTERLRLRPLTLDDVDIMLTYRGRADVCRYLPFEPMTRPTLLGRLHSDLSRVELSHEGQGLTLGVELRNGELRNGELRNGELKNGELIGDVVLFFRSLEHAGGELGYVFHPDVAGHGYATEACSAMLTLAFEQLGLHRVIARLDARNDASARLAARLGMRQEAHLVQNEMFKGEWSDELDFAMLATDWSASPAHSRRPPPRTA